MSAFATALGQLGESYGKAGMQSREAGIQDQQLELQKQAAQRQKILEQLAQKKYENELVDVGLPSYQDSGIPVRQMWSPAQGKVVQVKGQGGTPTGMEALREFIKQQDPEYQKELQSTASVELAGDPNNPQAALKAVVSRQQKLADQKESERRQAARDAASETRQGKRDIAFEARQSEREKATDARLSRTFAEQEKLLRMREGPSEEGGSSDPTVEKYAKALADKKLTLDYIDKIFVGKKGDLMRPKITSRAMELGWNPQAQMSPAAEKILMSTTPVLTQAQGMMEDIENLGLKDNNTGGYLAGARLKYAFGVAAPEGKLAKDIAGLSLGSVIEAASALQGSSRSIQALRKALVHTPNPWVDSPKQIYTKLTEITKRLNEITSDAKRYGTKSGLENTEVDDTKDVNDPLGVLPKKK